MSFELNRAGVIDGTIAAGERALADLQEAKSTMNSARTWGIFDMMGGGLISTFAKHRKIDQAKVQMEAAVRELEEFRGLLYELEGDFPEIVMNFQVGDFLSFADYFFDGLVADLIVQDKINQLRSQLDYAISEVQEALEALRRL